MSELPDGWIELPIGDVCQVVGGSTPKTSVDKYWDGDIPWLTPDDLSRDRSQYVLSGRRNITDAGYESCSTHLVPAGTVLFTSRAPIGYVAIAKQPVCTNQGFKSFVPSPGIDSRYLYWYLRWATPSIRKLGSGTTFAEISGKVAKRIPLRLAPLDERERIVAAIEEYFSRLDAGMTALDQVQRKSQRMIASLVEAALSGQLSRRDPNDEPAEVLLGRVHAERSMTAPIAFRRRTSKRVNTESQVPTELLPDGWMWVGLGDLADIDSGPAFPSEKFRGPDEGIRLLRGENIEPGKLRWTNTRTWPKELLPGYEHLRVEASDLILGMDRPVVTAGLKLAMVKSEDLPALLVQRVARIRPTQGITSRYLNIALRSRRFVPHLLRSQTGTQLPHITLEGIRSFALPLPPLQEQRRIAEQFDLQSSLVSDADKIARQSAIRAVSLRQAILSAAFRGDLAASEDR